MFPYSFSIKHVTALCLFYLVSALTCAEGACDPPPRLSYAHFKSDSGSTYEDNTKIYYDCSPGYKPIPGINNYVTCLGSSWTTPQIFCEVVKCGNPGEILNGEIEEPINQTFGSRVVFKCNTGYNMITKFSYRDCQNNGEWSNIVPICEAQMCPPPTAITDGDFSPQKDDYRYQDYVTFKCNKELTLVGTSSLFCTANGNWSSEEPNCRDVVCDNPSVVHGQKISGFFDRYKLNYAVTFQCDYGFELTGPETVTCTVNNVWEPPIPECRSKVKKEGTENAEEPGNHAGVIVGATLGVICCCCHIWVFSLLFYN